MTEVPVVIGWLEGDFCNEGDLGDVVNRLTWTAGCRSRPDSP